MAFSHNEFTPTFSASISNIDISSESMLFVKRIDKKESPKNEIKNTGNIHQLILASFVIT